MMLNLLINIDSSSLHRLSQSIIKSFVVIFFILAPLLIIRFGEVYFTLILLSVLFFFLMPTLLKNQLNSIFFNDHKNFLEITFFHTAFTTSSIRINYKELVVHEFRKMQSFDIFKKRDTLIIYSGKKKVFEIANDPNMLISDGQFNKVKNKLKEVAIEYSDEYNS